MKVTLNQQLFSTAMKLEGLPRHTSTHAAGVIISEMPLTDIFRFKQDMRAFI